MRRFEIDKPQNQVTTWGWDRAPTVACDGKCNLRKANRIGIVDWVSPSVGVPVSSTPRRIRRRKPPRPRIVIPLIRIIQPRLRIAEVAGELLDVVRRRRWLLLSVRKVALAARD